MFLKWRMSGGWLLTSNGQFQDDDSYDGILLQFNIDLQETLANIGNAYDNLHKELRAILETITENKHCPTPSKSTQLNVSRPNYKPKSKYTLDRRRLHDAQVKATLFDKNNDIRVAKVNKTTENAIFKKNKSLEAFLKQPVINATTITRYPLKSTGVGHQEPVECSARETCIRYKNMVSDKHACCKFHHEHCCNNWKY